MAFGGVIFAVWLFATPPGMYVRNGVAYFNISPVLLILATAGCYILITLASRFLHRNDLTASLFETEIVVGGADVRLTGLLDTGNTLCDQISGLPVIIAEYGKTEKIIPEALRPSFKRGNILDPDSFRSCGWASRLRMVPYGSVGNVGGLLPAFRPDLVRMRAKGKTVETADVLVAVCNRRLSEDGKYSVLLNAHLLHEIKVL